MKVKFEWDSTGLVTIGKKERIKTFSEGKKIQEWVNKVTVAFNGL